MSIKKWGHKIATLCSVLVSLNCNTTSENSCISLCATDRENYMQDTAIIGTCCRIWSTRNIPFYSKYETDTSLSHPTFLVDTVFYGPNCDQLIATVIHTYSRNLKTIHTNNQVDCRGTFVIGYRDIKSKRWKLYPWDFLTLVAYDNSSKTKNDLRNTLYNKLTEVSYDENDSLTGEKRIVENQFNLCDPKFWSQSIVWKKGLVVNNYYYFELRGNIQRDEPYPIDSNVVINMDSLYIN